MFKELQSLSKYLLIRKLGDGNFGEVWYATNQFTHENIALKLIKVPLNRRKKIQECLNEARIGNSCSHQNLVSVKNADIVNTGNLIFFIIEMSFFENGSITSQVNNDNDFLPITDSIKYIINVLESLEYLHEKKLIHGDIKPSNILLNSNGEAVLTDYGLTQYCIESSFIQAQGIYKPHIAPESALEGKISFQSDLYQVGITLYRLINGLSLLKNRFLSFASEKFKTAVENGNVVSNNDYQLFVPKCLKKIINKSTSKCLKTRYQNPLEMRRDLEKIHYSANWYLENGLWRGYDKKFSYGFDETIKPNSDFIEFTPWKQCLKTDRKTNINQFKGKFDPQKLLSKKKEFMQNIVKNYKGKSL